MVQGLSTVEKTTPIGETSDTCANLQKKNIVPIKRVNAWQGQVIDRLYE